MSSVGAWIAAWVIIIAGLYFLARSPWGAAIVYYVLWLSVILLLITHSDVISSVLTAGNVTQGQS